MKDTEALAQKGLPLEELSKSIQKKVKEFIFLKEQIEALQKEDLDESTAEDVKNLSLRLEELDEEISIAITRFDKEKHLKKLQQLQDAKKKSLEAKGEAKEPELALEEESPAIPEPLPTIEPVVKKVSVPEAPAQEVPQYEETPEPQYVEAEEEFEVKRTQKSKNGSLNILLIGVGAFLITWGAVNMFRESKK